MNKNFRKIIWIACSVAMLSTVAKEPDLGVFGALDLGRIESAKDHGDGEAEGFLMQRLYVNINISQQLNRNHFLNMGVGGLFWRSYTEGSEGRIIRFGPGISHTYMQNNLGDNFTLKYGYFSYKYNDAAKNLGEYLFRSEAYPVVLNTGGWSWLNSAAHPAVGVQARWKMLDGALTHDFLLLMEYFNAPIYDISPAYVAKWKPVEALTFGAGVSLHRFITPVKGARKLLTQNYKYYDESLFSQEEGGKYRLTVGEHSILTSLEDKNTNTFLVEDVKDELIENINNAADSATIDSAGKVALMAAIGSEQSGYIKDVSFSLSTVRPVAFFHLNIAKLMNLNPEMGLFDVYGEVSVLGTKNYPIFYRKVSERTPVMLGLSLPTYLLDHLSLEVEYLKNPVAQSLWSTFDETNLTPDPDFRYQNFSSDDFKWSLHGSKNLGKTFSIYAQVANDHLRLKDNFAIPNKISLTNRQKHWYWLVRFQWAL